MTINFKTPDIKELKPRILVLGVGGAGGNAINKMIESGLQGVEFVAVNTDAQDLIHSKAKAKIQIGLNLTTGLGAGSKIDIGQAAADESLNEIVNCLPRRRRVALAKTGPIKTAGIQIFGDEKIIRGLSDIRHGVVSWRLRCIKRGQRTNGIERNKRGQLC